MKSCKNLEKPEMAIEKQIKDAEKCFEKHMKSMGKHEKLDRNLGKDMKSSKKQMKGLEKISNADETCRKP